MSQGHDEVRRLALPPDEAGRPREALLVLEPGAEPKAYLNLCPHLDVPLDAGSADYGPRHGQLICRTHGARFRVADGLCTWGPCHGESLAALELQRDAEGLVVLFEGAKLRVGG